MGESQQWEAGGSKGGGLGGALGLMSNGNKVLFLPK